MHIAFFACRILKHLTMTFSILQTKKARSVLGPVRGPGPEGGGPDLAQDTGKDLRKLSTLQKLVI